MMKNWKLLCNLFCEWERLNKQQQILKVGFYQHDRRCFDDAS